MRKTTLFLFIIATYVLCNRAFSQSIGDTLQATEYTLFVADTLINAEKYDDALKVLSTIPEGDTLYALKNQKIAYTWFLKKEYRKMLEVSKKGIEAGSSWTLDFYAKTILAYKELKLYDSAIYISRIAEKRFPYTPLFPARRAAAYIAEKKWAAAQQDLNRALRINPLDNDAHFTVGELAAKAGHPALALMAVQMYMLLGTTQAERESGLAICDAIADDKSEWTKEAEVSVFQSQPAFDELNELVKAKVALSPKYKYKMPFDVTFGRQMQLIMERLETIEVPETDTLTKFYTDFYKKVWRDEHLKAFILATLDGLNNDAVSKQLKKNRTEVNEFVTSAGKSLGDMRKKKNLVLGDAAEDVVYYYNGGTYPSSFGKEDEEGTEQGFWKIYYNNGVLSGEGLMQDGKKTGIWHFYYPNERLKETTEFSSTGKVTTRFYPNESPELLLTVENDKVSGPYKKFNATGAPSVEAMLEDSKLVGELKEFDDRGNLAQTKQISNAMLDGPNISYFPGGKIKSEGSYSKDKRNGPFKQYFLNGKISYDYTLETGEAQGEFISNFSNGQTEEKGLYKKGKREGLWTRYFENGTVRDERNYSNGKATGAFKWFDDDGKLWATFIYKNDNIKYYEFFDKDGKSIVKTEEKGGKLVYTEYSPVGIKTEEAEYIDEKLEGNYMYYFPDGSSKEEVAYKGGILEGKRTKYHPNGKKRFEFVNSNGEAHGFYRSYFVNGQVEQEGYYKNGKKEGEWKDFYKNGVISTKIHYINGDQHGPEYSYLPDGTIDNVDYYENGALMKVILHSQLGVPYDTIDFRYGNGKYAFKYLNGKIRQSGEYKYGVREGNVQFIYGNGKVHTSSTYKNGYRQGISEEYFDSGKLYRNGNMVNGEKDSVWVEYSEDGKKFEEQTFSNGQLKGKEITYFPDGKIMHESEVSGSDYHGIMRSYAPDGSLAIQRRYKNGTLVSYTYEKDGALLPEVTVNGNATVVAYFPNGKKSIEYTLVNDTENGPYAMWYPDGNPKSEFTYQFGYTEGISKQYHSNGKLRWETSYKNLSRDGLQKEYDMNGKLKREIPWVNGVKHGKATWYDETGKVVRTANYIYGVEN